MSNDPRASIVYGLEFEEGHEFPWSDGKYEEDLDNWWLDIGGYKPIDYPYDDKGEYKEGYSESDPRIDKYYEHKNSWLKAHPIPFEVMYSGSWDSDTKVLIVPSTDINADWDPKIIEPDKLALRTVESEEAEQAFNACLRSHGLMDFDDKPRWLLVAFWG